MSRPKKAGLDYFYRGVHDWDSFAVMDLVEEYGPVGYCVYDVVLGKIYENGYYLEIPIERLALYVMRTVGNRWITDKQQTVEIIQYCGRVGLFDAGLLSQSVFTSADIQAHYSEVVARRKADKSQYWLLPPEESVSEIKEVTAAETEASAAITPVNAAKTQQRKAKKRKENKTKSNKSTAKKSSVSAAAAPPQNAVEEAFVSVTGKRFSQPDREALDRMYSEGADDSLIIQTIRRINARNISVSSMKYYIPVVLEALNASRKASASSGDCHPRQPDPVRMTYGRCPETSDMDDIERLLDEQWAAEVAAMSRRDSEECLPA